MSPALDAQERLYADPLGTFSITQACVTCVIMYKVAEIGPQRLPWVSGWRFGEIVSVEGECITMAPWPKHSEHPLATAWKRFHGMENTDLKVSPLTCCPHFCLLHLFRSLSA